LDDNLGLRLFPAKKQYRFFFLSNNKIISHKQKAEHIATVLKQINWKFLAAAEKPTFLI